MPQLPGIQAGAVGVGDDQGDARLFGGDQRLDVAGRGQVDMADVKIPFPHDSVQIRPVLQWMPVPGGDGGDFPAVPADDVLKVRVLRPGKEGDFILFRVQEL